MCVGALVPDARSQAGCVDAPDRISQRGRLHEGHRPSGEGRSQSDLRDGRRPQDKRCHRPPGPDRSLRAVRPRRQQRRRLLAMLSRDRRPAGGQGTVTRPCAAWLIPRRLGTTLRATPTRSASPAPEESADSRFRTEPTRDPTGAAALPALSATRPRDSSLGLAQRVTLAGILPRRCTMRLAAWLTASFLTLCPFVASNARAALIDLGPGSFPPLASVISFAEVPFGTVNPTFTFNGVPTLGSVTISFAGHFVGQAAGGSPTVTLTDHTPTGPLARDAASPDTVTVNDTAAVSSPVLSGTPTFNGPISILFSVP